MSAIEFLLNRQSNGFLRAPAPNTTDLDVILTAALAVPDHAGLNPYKFHIIENQGLAKLTKIYVQAIKANTDDQLKLEKAKKMAYRAPMTIVVSTHYQHHPKVPKQEQLITAGCAAHAMQMAAGALGYGAMWRTGDLAYSDIVKTGLGIESGNDIVGFLYLGTKSKELTNKPRRNHDQYTEYWN
ncbi:nitroreductase [Thalassotalea sp. 42_200_T64]|nr:nitroreductase [Thalassotalea sp. 42_200_T64]